MTIQADELPASSFTNEVLFQNVCIDYDLYVSRFDETRASELLRTSAVLLSAIAYNAD